MYICSWFKNEQRDIEISWWYWRCCRHGVLHCTTQIHPLEKLAGTLSSWQRDNQLPMDGFFPRTIVKVPRLYRISTCRCNSMWIDTAIPKCPWPAVMECFPTLPKWTFPHFVYQMRRCVNGYHNYPLPMACRHGVLCYTTQMYPLAKWARRSSSWWRDNQFWFYRTLFTMQYCVNGHCNYHLLIAYRHGVFLYTTKWTLSHFCLSDAKVWHWTMQFLL